MVKCSFSKTLLRECYATFVYNHGCLVAGIMFGLPACLTPQLKEEGYHVDAFMQSLLGSMPFIMTALMTFFILILTGEYGRKTIQQICLVILIISLTVIIFSTTMWLLCCGFAVACSAMSFITPLIAAYVSETCRKERRGVLLGTSFICFSCGSAVIFILNLFFTWREIMAVQLLIAVCGFIQIFFIPETKYWYLVKGDVDSAKRSMLWFQPDLSAAEIDVQIKAMQESLEPNNTSNGHFTKLFQHLKNKKVRKPLYIGLLVNFFRSGEGRVVLSVYFFDIFKEIEVPYDLKVWTAFYGVVYLICIVGVLAITSSLNRKVAVYVWTSIMAVSMTIVIAYMFLHKSNIYIPPWVPIISVYAYFLFSMSGLYSAVFTIITELQVAYCRPEMTALLNGQVCVCFGFYAFIFPYAKMWFPIEFILMVFLFNLIALTLLICVLVPETSSFEFYETFSKQKLGQSQSKEP